MTGSPGPVSPRWIYLNLSWSVFISTISTQVFGNLGMAEVHGPKLPSLGKPDLAKLTGQMSSCLALAQWRQGQGAGQGAGPGTRGTEEQKRENWTRCDVGQHSKLT